MAFPKAYRLDKSKAFSDHLAELRSRAIACVLSLLIGTTAGYFLYDELISLLVSPLGRPVFYSSPAGGIDFVIKMCLLFGFILALPVIVYNILRFVEPAFAKKSTRQLFLLFFFSCLLLFAGIAFGYFVSLPAALYFLSAFSNENVQALISAEEYFSFVARYLLGFGILFQFPLFLIVINSVNRIGVKQLLQKEKWVVLGSFIVAAFLTPTPDVMNQLIMVIPLLLLYQLSIVVIWIINANSYK